MKRFLFILACLTCVLACKREVLPPEEPEVPLDWEWNEADATSTPYDADDVDWASAMDYVFDDSVIPQLYLFITQEQWNTILDAFDKDPDTQEFITCNVIFRKGDEITKIKDAGFRLKGNTSRRRPYADGQFHHFHFGLNLQKYQGDQEHSINGLRRVDMKWFKDDATYAREIFCYDLFRRSGVWTAVNSIYSRLWIKIGDEKAVYYGVYELLEHIDKDYLRARVDEFGNKKGDLWKCSTSNGVHAYLDNPNAEMALDDDVHKPVYELKTGKEADFPGAQARLQDFIQHLTDLNGAAFNEWIAAHMDVDLLLRTYAVNVAVGMWDDYWNSGSNYFLYIAPEKKTDNYKVWLIPYDYDNTLGISMKYCAMTDSGRQDPWKWGVDSAPLMTKVLKNPEWAALYKKYLQELCSESGDFYYKTAMARIKAWQDSVAPYVSNDTNEDMVIKDRVPTEWCDPNLEYRIMTEGADNFFQVKAAAVNKM